MASRRLLVLGVGPMPHEAGRMLFAPGLRLDFLARSLSKRGHRITVGRAFFDEVAGSGGAEGAGETEQIAEAAPFEVRKLRTDGPEELRRWHERDRFDAVLACTDVMADLAARARLPVPLLIDYNGEAMCELQLQGMRARNDEALAGGFAKLLPALLAADRFTVCSAAQRHALIGQLGLVGRLNRLSAREDLVSVFRPIWSLNYPEKEPPEDLSGFRGKTVPQGAFIILWSGGYNNWADTETLFRALEQTMELVPEAHFISTGGRIAGHAESTFDEFREWVEESSHRERYHFLGWVPTDTMPHVYRLADAAVNLDIPSYEAELGCRNRLYEWGHFGTVPVTTAVCELAQDMVSAGAAVGIEPGDPAGLASALVELAGNKERRDEMRNRGQAFVERWRSAAIPDVIYRWAEFPVSAPDLPALPDRPNCRWVAPDNELAHTHIDAWLGGAVAAHRADRGSRLYRAYRALKRK